MLNQVPPSRLSARPHAFRRLWIPPLLTVSLLLSSCAPIARWTPSDADGPVPPLAGPRLAALPAAADSLAGVPAATTTPTATPSATPTSAATLRPTRTPTPTPTPEPIEPLTLAQAQECLARGQVVYALALQNTNVRDAAGTLACRVGRVPKGTLIRILGAHVETLPVFETPTGEVVQEDEPASALSAAAEANAASFPAMDPAPDLAAVATPAQTAEPMLTPVRAASPTATVAPRLVVAPSAPPIGYSEDVQPIFLRACNVCHSAVAQTKGLMVTTYAGVMKGSTSGPVVIPGDAANSILWQMLEAGKMPLMGKLTATELTTIRAWIVAGAPEVRPPTPTSAAGLADTQSTPRATSMPMTLLATVTPAAPVDVDRDDDGDGATASSFARPRPSPAATLPLSAAASPALAGARIWLDVRPGDFYPVSESCGDTAADPLAVVSSDLVLPLTCGRQPQLGPLNDLRTQLALPLVAGGAAPAATPAPATASRPSATPATLAVAAGESETLTGTAGVSAAVAPTVTVPLSTAVAASAEVAPAFQALSGGATGINAPALGLPAASDGDGWLMPRGGLCLQRFLPDNKRGITSLAFAPDGRLFLGLDSNLAGEVDPLILYDAYHPSRSVAVIQPGNTNFEEIFVESTRITGMDWHDGTLYISRSGEVGRIVDGGEYEPLAGGFAVNSQLFHANNGLVVSGGWLYVSAGGVMDGYSEGPIVGIGEGGAQALVSGGNPYAARIVRAPLDSLLATKSISAFSTAARGVRNPYGITADPAGGIWFTDNGATNLPDDVSAGDEVNLLAPSAIGGADSTSPYYGFPLALTGAAEWYSDPAITLPNTSAPTGITWALGTIYFAQYGKNPGLYRVGVDGAGTLVAERLLLGWPILALATAPDGALWMGMGDGGLFRMTTGCG